MVRKLILTATGLALTVLGLIGLVLPVVPGILLLGGAAVCFSMVSPRFHGAIETRMRRHPRLRLAQLRWRAGRGLSRARRTALAFWLAVGSLLPTGRR
jgi:uncharacterized protein